MALARIIFILSAALAWLNGAIIISGDLFIGVRTAIPVVSLIVGLLFGVVGLFIYLIGIYLHRVWIYLCDKQPSHVPNAFRRLSTCLVLMAVIHGFMMMVSLSALFNRISEGYSIFG